MCPVVTEPLCNGSSHGQVVKQTTLDQKVTGSILVWVEKLLLCYHLMLDRRSRKIRQVARSRVLLLSLD